MNLVFALLFAVVLAAVPGRPQPFTLLLAGDSIATGMNAFGKTGICREEIAHAFGNVDIRVAAWPGRQMKEVLARFDADTPRPSGSGDHVIFLHAGDNDVIHHANAVDIYADLTSYVAKAHRLGWKVVASTEMQRFDRNAADQAQIDAFDALVRENRAGADAVADFAAIKQMEPRASRTDPRLYSKDGIHPAEAGYGILWNIAIAAISHEL